MVVRLLLFSLVIVSNTLLPKTFVWLRTFLALSKFTIDLIYVTTLNGKVDWKFSFVKTAVRFRISIAGIKYHIPSQMQQQKSKSFTDALSSELWPTITKLISSRCKLASSLHFNTKQTLGRKDILFTGF